MVLVLQYSIGKSLSGVMFSTVFTPSTVTGKENEGVESKTTAIPTPTKMSFKTFYHAEIVPVANQWLF